MSNVTKTGGTEKKASARTGENTKSASKAATTVASESRRSTSKTSKSNSASSSTPTRIVSAEEREKMIALAAYVRAERRGFAGGDPMTDWLEAEAEIDGILAKSSH